MPTITASTLAIPTSAVEPVRQPDTTVQAVTPLAQPAAEPKVEADQEMSPKFAALARKEKAIRQAQQALKAERDKLETDRTEYQSKYISRDRLTTDTLGVLKELGISYDQLTNLILNGDNPQNTELTELRQQIKSLTEKQTLQETEAQKREREQYETAVNQIRSDVKGLVSTDAQYESIKATGSEEAVVELIKAVFEKEGTILTLDDACKQVEDYIVEEATKMAALSKVRAKLTPATPEPEKQPTLTTQKQPQSTGATTLTNAATPSVTKPLSRAERRQRAMLAFKGELRN